MSEAESAAEESGKEALYLDQVPKTVTPVEVKEKGLLYFRKPDVNHTDGVLMQWSCLMCSLDGCERQSLTC